MYLDEAEKTENMWLVRNKQDMIVKIFYNKKKAVEYIQNKTINQKRKQYEFTSTTTTR